MPTIYTFFLHSLAVQSPPIARNMWLQHVVCLYPHGHAVTFYLGPSHSVVDLKNFLGTIYSTSGPCGSAPYLSTARLEGVEIGDQLLLDDSGKALEDHLPLQSYDLHKKDTPLYFIPLNHLVRLSKCVSRGIFLT